MEWNAPADSAAWIPAPPEDLESPDQLEGRAAVRGAGIAASYRNGRLGAGRAFVRTRLPFRRLTAEGSWLPRGNRPAWSTFRVETAGGRLQAAAGAMVSRDGPVLLSEALGLIRPLRAPRSPRLGPGEFEAPLGATSLAFSGAGVRGRAEHAAAWCLAGRDVAGAPLVSGGLAAMRGGSSVAVSGGTRGPSGAGGPESAYKSRRRVASVAGRVAVKDRWVAGEVLASPSRGPAFLLETAGRSGPFLAAARWRRRSGEERPVAGELTLEAGGGAAGRSRSGARMRLTWSSWSSLAPSDDGRLELETAVRRASRGPGSARVRIGGRPGGERYVLADLEIARERGRSFTLIASRRERRRAGVSSTASTWGGRFDWSARGRAGATVFLQASRVSVADGVSSWATSIAPSGEEAIVARGRAGVVVTGRAYVRAGPLRVEALLSDAGSSDADTPMRGTLRLEWAHQGD